MPEAQPRPTACKSKRLWFQFSLRTLLIVMTVFAVWIGLTADRVNRQRRAVEALSEMRVQLRYDYQAVPDAGMPYNPQLEPPGPEWLRELVGEHYFITPVRLVVLDRDAIDEGCLAYLEDLPDLEEVTFTEGVKLRDCDLAHLKHLRKVRVLNFLEGTLSGDDGPRHFDFLSNCRRLEELSAANSRFGNADLAHLKRARNLRCLLLSETSVGDGGLAHLKHLTSLDTLELSRTRVTDAGLAHLRSLKRLTYLGLNETKVTDVGLEHLKGLTGLARLGLSGTRVTEEGVKDLQSALPKCRIER